MIQFQNLYHFNSMKLFSWYFVLTETVFSKSISGFLVFWILLEKIHNGVLLNKFLSCTFATYLTSVLSLEFQKTFRKQNLDEWFCFRSSQDFKLKRSFNLDPLDTGRKLNVQKMSRTSSERLMYAQFTSCVLGDMLWAFSELSEENLFLSLFLHLYVKTQFRYSESKALSARSQAF